MVRMHHFIALFFIVADSSAQCSSVTSKFDDEVKIKKSWSIRMFAWRAGVHKKAFRHRCGLKVGTYF